MSDKIIFPFNSKEDNREMFVKAIQAAELSNEKVVLFTTIEGEDLEKEFDHVYEHFFELNGFFQTYYNNWKKIKPPLERVIREGDLGENLVAYLKELNTPVKIVVSCDSKEMNRERLEGLFKNLKIPPNLI